MVEKVEKLWMNCIGEFGVNEYRKSACLDLISDRLFLNSKIVVNISYLKSCVAELLCNLLSQNRGVSCLYNKLG